MIYDLDNSGPYWMWNYGESRPKLYLYPNFQFEEEGLIYTYELVYSEKDDAYVGKSLTIGKSLDWADELEYMSLEKAYQNGYKPILDQVWKHTRLTFLTADLTPAMPHFCPCCGMQEPYKRMMKEIGELLGPIPDGEVRCIYCYHQLTRFSVGKFLRKRYGFIETLKIKRKQKNVYRVMCDYASHCHFERKRINEIRKNEKTE